MDSSLSPERAAQIRTLFSAVLDLDPGERAAYLNQVCRDDSALRRETKRATRLPVSVAAVRHLR